MSEEWSRHHFKMFLPSESLYLCFFIIILPQWSYQICELLTNDEVHSIFQTECDTVPEYQVVPVLHSLNTKNESNPRVYFKSFGQDVILYLWPADGMLFGRHTPVYTVESDKSSPRGLKYTKYDTYGIYYAYHDEPNNAAIIVRRGTNDSYKFDGTFGQHFAIRSLPERVIKDVISKNESYHRTKLFPSVIKNNQNYSQTVHHLIIKMKDVTKALKIFYNHSYLKNNYSAIRDKRNSRNLDFDIVYPEIMSIVEYDTFRSFKFDISEVLVYLIAFWNGVDLRYRSLSDPKVRLNIASIIIGLDRNATPYFNNYRNDNSRISTDSIEAMGRYFYGEERFERSSYDIVIAVTRSTVCERLKTTENSTCVPLRGVSQLGSACMRSNEKKSIESVGLIHDQGFNGVATAAHELGHILGVPHDGSQSPQYIGGPGATKCNWQDGYMMSSERFGRNAFKWSNCSLECFKFFLKQPIAKCLYNKPKFNTALPRILPGTLLSLDEQCYQAGALEACYHDERACVLLYCTMPKKRDHCVATAPAAEGSTCGDGKICLQGKCIEQHQWRNIDMTLPL